MDAYPSSPKNNNYCTGPRFYPGLSQPDESRWAPLVSAGAETRLNFDAQPAAYIHLPGGVSPRGKEQAERRLNCTTVHRAKNATETRDLLLLADEMQQFFLLQQCLPSISWGCGLPGCAAFALSSYLRKSLYIGMDIAVIKLQILAYYD